MPIDWFTVFAQVINFLVLVWLLKRFLYKPILNAIDEREKGIARQFADAEAMKAEAKHERDDLQHKTETFDKTRADLLLHATDEAKAERQRMLDDARNEADAIRLKLQESRRTEQLHLSDLVVRWTHEEVIATARKALSDLASVSLEERMSEVFLLRLRELTLENKNLLAAALKNSNDAVRVRSAFNLTSAQQVMIEKAISEEFAVPIHPQFETVPELVCGIELVADGQKLAWSITDYLVELEKSVGQLFHSGTTVDSKAVESIESEPVSEVKTSSGSGNP